MQVLVTGIQGACAYAARVGGDIVLQTFPSLPSSGSYSAMYSPKLEEYLLTNPADVLPEFLVQVRRHPRCRMRCVVLVRTALVPAS